MSSLPGREGKPGPVAQELPDCQNWAQTHQPHQSSISAPWIWQIIPAQQIRVTNCTSSLTAAHHHPHYLINLFSFTIFVPAESCLWLSALPGEKLAGRVLPFLHRGRCSRALTEPRHSSDLLGSSGLRRAQGSQIHAGSFLSKCGVLPGGWTGPPTGASSCMGCTLLCSF